VHFWRTFLLVFTVLFSKSYALIPFLNLHANNQMLNHFNSTAIGKIELQVGKKDEGAGQIADGQCGELSIINVEPTFVATHALRCFPMAFNPQPCSQKTTHLSGNPSSNFTCPGTCPDLFNGIVIEGPQIAPDCDLESGAYSHFSLLFALFQFI